MSLTLHDLRVSLRDKTKLIEDLERKMRIYQAEMEEKDMFIKEIETGIAKKDEIILLKDSLIKEKDSYIVKLESELLSLRQELNKYKENAHKPVQNGILETKSNGIFKNQTNVLKNPPPAPTSNKPTPKIEIKHLQVQSNLKSKRIAISGESAQNRFNNKTKEKISLKEYTKSQETNEFLTNSIYENDFMKNLEIDQIDCIVNCMYPVEFPKESIIIREGDVGNSVYIIEEGRVEVTKNSKLLCTMSSGKVFGELAILYNCTRTASIRALSLCKLWAIDRTTFQVIMMRSGMEKHEEYMDLLKNIPTFQGIREDIISKLIDKVDECSYNMNDFIVRQFAKGDTFYIISKGRAKVTKSASKWDSPKFIKYLNRGEYFGENALQGEETRPFNVIADDPNGVTCLVLDRQYYKQFVNDNEFSNLKRVESIKINLNVSLITKYRHNHMNLCHYRIKETFIIIKHVSLESSTSSTHTQIQNLHFPFIVNLNCICSKLVLQMQMVQQTQSHQMSDNNVQNLRNNNNKKKRKIFDINK
ncbi:cGMP-dependent kinase 1-like [Brachionus plicatilis]|uniref:cGMP-dependent kinase 1-like n=1 Tax=Brachionus plicatilis TaxID=10195 RepID=A0A3M7QXM8_BRAPC|nr:cGMP-dependent kinase 1-like [Brachionus plicatilis]